MSVQDDWSHVHAAHCESGVTRALFQNHGLELSEPMVFGLSGGVFFGHLSFIDVMGHPLTTFRTMPGWIFKKACERAGVVCTRETYRSADAGMRRLDELLDQGHCVGLQLNIYWLPYIPKAMRVHFNGHNLVVVGRSGDHYRVSDPVMEEVFECPAADLSRARFSANLPLMGKGLAYFPTAFPQGDVDLTAGIHAGLTQACNHMLRIPFVLPWFGVRGIRHLAGRVRRWPSSGDRRAREWMAGLVRMQEEIGTGGAGFRYLFAAFLDEAQHVVADPRLGDVARRCTDVGDQWRRFALHASRLARKRPDKTYDEMADLLLALHDAERDLFLELDRVRKAPLQLTG